MDWTTQYCYDVKTTRGNVQIQCHPYQNPNYIFEEIEKSILNLMWSLKRLCMQSNNIYIFLITIILYEYWHRNPRQNMRKPKENIKRFIHHNQVGFIPGIWEWVHRQKLINVICHLNRMKEKKTQIISIDAMEEWQSSNF